jgi:hypothetical protein
MENNKKKMTKRNDEQIFEQLLQSIDNDEAIISVFKIIALEIKNEKKEKTQTQFITSVFEALKVILPNFKQTVVHRKL